MAISCLKAEHRVRERERIHEKTAQQLSSLLLIKFIISRRFAFHFKRLATVRYVFAFIVEIVTSSSGCSFINVRTSPYVRYRPSVH